MPFQIDGPYKLRLKNYHVEQSEIHVRWVDKQSSLDKLKQQRVKHKTGGVYVFAIRTKGKGAALPWYVGLNKASKTHSSLYREALTNEKLRKYARALAQMGSGTALLYFLSPKDLRSDDIGQLETFLIWLARQRNPRLINTKKVRLSPSSLSGHLKQHRIEGVLSSSVGKPSKSASDFRKMIGWNKPMHVTASVV